jgi:hypothetical protein
MRLRGVAPLIFQSGETVIEFTNVMGCHDRPASLTPGIQKKPSRKRAIRSARGVPDSNSRRAGFPGCER